jgi:hypothetical protein
MFLSSNLWINRADIAITEKSTWSTLQQAFSLSRISIIPQRVVAIYGV